MPTVKTEIFERVKQYICRGAKEKNKNYNFLKQAVKKLKTHMPHTILSLKFMKNKSIHINMAIFYRWCLWTVLRMRVMRNREARSARHNKLLQPTVYALSVCVHTRKLALSHTNRHRIHCG